jgi:hypothetical protein
MYVFQPSARKFDRAHIKFDFETHSGGLELGNTARLLLANTISVTTPCTPRDMNPPTAMLSLAYWRGWGRNFPEQR